MAASTRSSQSVNESSTTARYNASFDAKWCKRLGRRIPTSSAISVRLVPAYPCSAKRCVAARRMRSFVLGMRTFVLGMSEEDARAAMTSEVGRSKWVKRDPAYRLVGSNVPSMSWTHVLAAVIAAFVVTQIAIFTTTVYLHRGLSHRALTVEPAAALPFRIITWITTGMRPREWVAVHRKHHAATDT